MDTMGGVAWAFYIITNTTTIVYELSLYIAMDPIGMPDIMRSIDGLTIMIMNAMSMLVLFRCKKMAFQIRIFTLQLAIASFFIELSTHRSTESNTLQGYVTSVMNSERGYIELSLLYMERRFNIYLIS